MKWLSSGCYFMYAELYCDYADSLTWYSEIQLMNTVRLVAKAFILISHAVDFRANLGYKPLLPQWYTQEKLMPRVTQAYRNEDFDPKILAEMVSSILAYTYCLSFIRFKIAYMNSPLNLLIIFCCVCDIGRTWVVRRYH